MTRKISILLTLLLTLPLLAETRQRYAVRTKDAVPASRLRIGTNAAGETGALRMRTFAHVPGFAADLTEAEANALRRSADVVSVQPLVERVASDLSSEGRFEVAPNAEYDVQVEPWGFSAVHARQVWGVTQGETVNVAVLDTGLDLEHPDLAHAIAGGYNTFSATASIQDDHKHGTHVGGIIAAADNAFGVVGVSPKVKLWGVKVLDGNGKGSDENVAAGIDWVVSKKRQMGGRWVINMSLGSSSGSDLEAAAVSTAYNEGIILVAAAGNNRRAELDYPAAYVEVIAVSATDEQGERASFSSYGSGVSVAAPGTLIPSTLPEIASDTVASVITPNEAPRTWGITGSGTGTITGMIVDCGLGRPEDFPDDVKGNVALVRRGEIQFREKSRNAKLAGAAAVIIYNNEPVDPTRGWTLIVDDGNPLFKDFDFPVTVAVNVGTGVALQHSVRPVSVSYAVIRYGKLSGTSMATPYVSGIVALMLSVAPGLNPAQVNWILRETATDVGDPGWDPETADGVADALAAVKYAAPEKFGEIPPPPSPARRRSVRP